MSQMFFTPTLYNATTHSAFQDGSGNWKPPTQLWTADPTGAPGVTPLGFVLACPQSCAKSRPGYAAVKSSRALSAIYLKTPEWMREIIYTSDQIATPIAGDPLTPQQKFRQYRKLLGSGRISNDSATSGCGHVSRNVTITKVTLTGGNLVETPQGTQSSLVFSGNQSGSAFNADNIYVYAGDWAPATGNNVQKVLDEIDTELRPIDASPCG